jgi:hypothetical protein
VGIKVGCNLPGMKEKSVNSEPNVINKSGEIKKESNSTED